MHHECFDKAGQSIPHRVCGGRNSKEVVSVCQKRSSSSQSLSGMLDETLLVQLKVASRRAASQPHKETKLSDFHEFSSNNSAIFFGLCWTIIIVILITTGININMMRGGTERLRVSGQLPSLHLDTRGVAWFQVWACP